MLASSQIAILKFTFFAILLWNGNFSPIPNKYSQALLNIFFLITRRITQNMSHYGSKMGCEWQFTLIFKFNTWGKLHLADEITEDTGSSSWNLIPVANSRQSLPQGPLEEGDSVSLIRPWGRINHCPDLSQGLVAVVCWLFCWKRTASFSPRYNERGCSLWFVCLCLVRGWYGWGAGRPVVMQSGVFVVQTGCVRYC